MHEVGNALAKRAMNEGGVGHGKRYDGGPKSNGKNGENPRANVEREMI